MKTFDSYDFEVVKAHGIGSGAAEDGGADLWQIRRHHPGPLPVQRLAGLARRGLMRRDPEDGRWFLTSEGAKQAHAYRDSIASEGSDRR